MAALAALVGAAGAWAAKAPGTVSLKVAVTGSGTVHVTGSPALTCHAASCHYTFHVRRGQQVVVRASPHAGWKLARWAGVCKDSGATCFLKLEGRRTVAVTFVPPGDRLNPYRLGRSVVLAGGWRLKVDSAILDADAQVEAVTDQDGMPVNPPPPAGAQYTLVNVSMRYVGRRWGVVSSYSHTLATGSRDASYALDSACRPPSLDLASGYEEVRSGHTATGTLCYEIASSDAGTLLLGGESSTNEGFGPSVWFALR